MSVAFDLDRNVVFGFSRTGWRTDWVLLHRGADACRSINEGANSDSSSTWAAIVAPSASPKMTAAIADASTTRVIAVFPDHPHRF